MKKLTRLLCLLLCAVLVCGMLPPAAVSAEGPATEDQWQYVKEEETEEVEEVPERDAPAVELPQVEQIEKAPAVDAVTKHNEYSYSIENLADLKEVLAIVEGSGSWASINYSGSEPLVVNEDITIPEDVALYVNGVLQIAEGATLTIEWTDNGNGQLTADEIQVDGTLVNRGHFRVKNKITVNGSVVSDNIYVDYKGQIEGLDKIQFTDEWRHVVLEASTESIEEMIAALNEISPKVGGKIEGSVSLWTGPEETGMVLNQSVTVPDGVTLSVGGEYGPFVIGEGATLTLSEDQSFYFDKLVVKGTLILPEGGYMNGDELQVDGTVDVSDMIYIYKKLTVNGTMNAAGVVYMSEGAEVVGMEKIRFEDYGHIVFNYSVDSVEAFYEKLASASAMVGDKVHSSINLNGTETAVLDKSFTVSQNMSVSIYTPVTIAQGCTVTVDGGIYVHENLVLKGAVQINESGNVDVYCDGSTLEIAGGKISGKGYFYVYAEDFDTAVSGLDLNKYEVIREWDDCCSIHNVESLTKLSAPAKPKWGIRYEFKYNREKKDYDVKELAVPASVAIAGVDGAQFIDIRCFFESADGPKQVYGIRYTINDKASIDIFQDEDRPSGTYYFTVQAIGDYETTRSSDIVTSEKYVYTNPGKRLEKVTNLKAENDTITWDAHPQADLVDYYTLNIWYAPTAEAEPENMWWSLDSEDNTARLPERIKNYIGEGYYYFEVVAHPKDATKITVSEPAMSNSMKVELPETIRYAGENRFETSFKVADAIKKYEGEDKLGYVIVASGANFADALAGSYLSWWYGAPILLSYKEEQNNQVKEYIKANLVEDGVVFILGGEKAVPKSIEVGLEAYEIVRLAGTDRFRTNLEILGETGVPENAPILVATGTNFADSLSASAVGLPILLVHKKLTAEQKDFLSKNADPKKNPVIILGGKNAVNETVEGEFKALGFDVERLAGENRFQTSVMIAEKFFEDPDSVVLAYAANYPDGLCGGGLAVWMNAPLILTMDKQEAVAAEYAKKVGIERAVTLGGEGLISDAAVNTILGK